jgi:Porin-like glycoporin RafY
LQSIAILLKYASLLNVRIVASLKANNRNSKPPFLNLEKKVIMKTIAKSAIALAAAVLASSAMADVSFNANIETNTTKKTGVSLDNGGRVEVNAVAQLLKEGENFVNAKGTFEIPLTGTTNNIADAWIQFGNNSADFKLGRFEAVDLFPLGKDVVVEGAGAAAGYRANTLRGRFADGQMHSALGFNASSSLRFEIGMVSRKDASAKPYGLRPTVTYTAGALALRAGLESIKVEGTNATARTATGVSIGYNINPSASLNLNFANDNTADAKSSGVNVVFGDAGLGLVQDQTGTIKQTTAYAAYSFPLMGIKGASLTPALSRSNSAGVPTVSTFRVRMNYAF